MMLKIKERKIIEEELTIHDFIRLWFDDCTLRELDKNCPFGFFASGKWELSSEEKEKNILKFGLSPAYMKTDSFIFLSDLLQEINSEQSSFPKKKHTKTIPNNIFNSQQFDFYKVSEILDWLSDNVVGLDSNAIPDWAKEYFNRKQRRVDLDSLDEGLIRMDMLPPLLKFAVKVHVKMDWDNNPSNANIYDEMYRIASKERLNNLPNKKQLTGKAENLNFTESGNDRKSLSKVVWTTVAKIIKP